MKFVKANKKQGRFYTFCSFTAVSKKKPGTQYLMTDNKEPNNNRSFGRLLYSKTGAAKYADKGQ